jgi:single-strand DNA-binding protein
MPSFNRVILIGRLTRDPELRYTAGGLAVTTFSIAVDRRFKNQQGERVTDFFRCKAWRQKAEFVANYVGKGRLVAVEGAIEMNEMTGQDGQKRYFTDIVCDNVEILESQRDAAGGDAGAPGMGAASGMGNGAGNTAGGVGPGAGARGAGDDADNGYFPDDDAAAAPPRTQNRAQGAQNAPSAQNAPGARNAAGANGAQRGASGAGGASGGTGGTRSQPPAEARRPVEPAYPADDFDDSDPFADQ